MIDLVAGRRALSGIEAAKIFVQVDFTQRLKDTESLSSEHRITGSAIQRIAWRASTHRTYTNVSATQRETRQ